MMRKNFDSMTPEEREEWQEIREERQAIIVPIVVTILMHAVLYRLGL